ncbi:MAG: glycosyltransferase family 2 protein [Gammaproteobacteria bacterium]
MHCPLFSVIIPVFNAENTIEATINSLQAQTLEDWEAVIVNDASTDKSAELLSTMIAQDTRLNFLNDLTQNSPLGVSKSRNKGIDHATGQYIAFLDSDDLWYPNKLTLQRDRFASGADIVFSAYKRVDPSGQNLGIVAARRKITWQDALAGNPIGCLTGAYRKARFAEARMPDLALHEDYAFWLDLLSTGAEAVGLPDVLAEYRVAPGSRSANKLHAAAAVWNILKTQNISQGRRVLSFARYTLNSVKRRVNL